MKADIILIYIRGNTFFGIYSKAVFSAKSAASLRQNSNIKGSTHFVENSKNTEFNTKIQVKRILYAEKHYFEKFRTQQNFSTLTDLY